MLIICPGGRSVPLVLLFYCVVKSVPVIRPEKGFTAFGVFDEARDPGQGFEVKSGRILRCYKKEKKVHRPTIVGIKIDPLRRTAEDKKNLVEPAESPMGYGHTVTDTCAAQHLSIQENIYKLLGIVDFTGLLEMGDHFLDYTFPRGGM